MKKHVWSEVTPTSQEGLPPGKKWFQCNDCGCGFPTDPALSADDGFQEHLKVTEVIFEDCDDTLASSVVLQ